MSCNGCRVLRKGCREECMLRHSLKWIQSPQAQAHATLFLTKFFGRAALMSFLSSVPPNQTSELFQSLLYEAVGRTINPVNGAVGMLCTGNWHLCQLAVEQVLRGGGGALTPVLMSGASSEDDYCCSINNHQGIMLIKRKVVGTDDDDGNRGHQQAKKQRAAGTLPNEDSVSTTFGIISGSKEERQHYYCASQTQSNHKLLTLFF